MLSKDQLKEMIQYYDINVYASLKVHHFLWV